MVISLLIANCKIKGILIDNDSSTNVLFMNALKEIKIDKSNIRRCSTVLLGFRGEQKFTIGDITLPVYVGGVNLNITFIVLDRSSAYNVIIGRPWIHKMRVVPSTFHQVVRFLTKWGVKEIKGKQSISRECYCNTLRAKPATLQQLQTAPADLITNFTPNALALANKELLGITEHPASK